MLVRCRTFSIQKQGEPFDDYEDACYPSEDSYERSHNGIYNNESEFRCAVADGATQSFASSMWSDALVKSYGAGAIDNDLTFESLIPLQQRWSQEIDKLDLAWNEEAIAKNGAHAAFVGLSLQSEKSSWSAVAVGDSCVFQIREGDIVAYLPELKSDDFKKSPALLCTRKAITRKVLESGVLRSQGTWSKGDIFLLTSDALALWLVRARESGLQRAALDRLIALSELQSFKTLVDSERQKVGEDGVAGLRNDDTTLVLAEVS